MSTIDSQSSPSQSVVDAWYEKHNDEARNGRDNEMSRREIAAFRDDASLSAADKEIANFVYEHRNEFDADGNGRLSRSEFHRAVFMRSEQQSPSVQAVGRANALYEKHNDEAARGQDNEMSKREIRSFANDGSLSAKERKAAQTILDNRHDFDVDNNGRLNRNEFLQALSTVLEGDSESAPPVSDAPKPNASTSDYRAGAFTAKPEVERDGSIRLGGQQVDTTTQAGVLMSRTERSNKNVDIETNVREGQTQFVTIGTSNGGSTSKDVDTPVDKKLMEAQGFELLGVEGSRDKRVEIWGRVFEPENMDATVTLSANSKDVGYAIHTLDKSLDLDALSLRKDAFAKDGNSRVEFNGRNSYDLKLGAIFFDDSVEIENAGGRTVDYGKFEGKSDANTVQFFKQGDGDGFFVGLWGEGESVRGSYDIDNHAPGGRQQESLFIGGNV